MESSTMPAAALSGVITDYSYSKSGAAMYKVYYVPFPVEVNDVFGAIHLCPDGSYIIAIDSRLDTDARAAVLEHELEHIRQGHFFTDKQIQQIEAETEEAALKVMGGRHHATR